MTQDTRGLVVGSDTGDVLASTVAIEIAGRGVEPDTDRLRRTARPRQRLTGARLLGARIVAALVATLLLEAAVRFGAVPATAVAAPTDAIASLVGLLGTGPFWQAVAATVRTWGLGLVIAMIVAVPAGLLVGVNPVLDRLVRFSVDFMRTIPPVALIPLALLLFGASDMMALVLIVFGSVWPLFLQSVYGAAQVDAVARDVARSYRIRRRLVVLDVLVPSAAPFIATGIRIAATMSLLLAIGTEFIGGAPGIGLAISLAQQGGDIPQMYAYILIGAVFGVLLNLLFLQIERRLLAWHSANR